MIVFAIAGETRLKGLLSELSAFIFAFAFVCGLAGFTTAFFGAFATAVIFGLAFSAGFFALCAFSVAAFVFDWESLA